VRFVKHYIHSSHQITPFTVIIESSRYTSGKHPCCWNSMKLALVDILIALVRLSFLVDCLVNMKCHRNVESISLSLSENKNYSDFYLLFDVVVWADPPSLYVPA
jgi:hypothetical protein